jgi:hypothetical protein
MKEHVMKFTSVVPKSTKILVENEIICEKIDHVEKAVNFNKNYESIINNEKQDKRLHETHLINKNVEEEFVGKESIEESSENDNIELVWEKNIEEVDRVQIEENEVVNLISMQNFVEDAIIENIQIEKMEDIIEKNIEVVVKPEEGIIKEVVKSEQNIEVDKKSEKQNFVEEKNVKEGDNFEENVAIDLAFITDFLQPSFENAVNDDVETKIVEKNKTIFAESETTTTSSENVKTEEKKRKKKKKLKKKKLKKKKKKKLRHGTREKVMVGQ